MDTSSSPRRFWISGRTRNVYSQKAHVYADGNLMRFLGISPDVCASVRSWGDVRSEKYRFRYCVFLCVCFVRTNVKTRNRNGIVISTDESIRSRGYFRDGESDAESFNRKEIEQVCSGCE